LMNIPLPPTELSIFLFLVRQTTIPYQAKYCTLDRQKVDL
jgi:hypothetical protein